VTAGNRFWQKSVMALLTAMLLVAAQPIALRYERAEGAERCPDQPALERSVTARLGRSPFDPNASDALAVRVSATESGLVAVVVRLDAKAQPRGRRELSSPSRDCRELSEAIELALVLAIDPLRAAARPPAPSPQPPPAAPAQLPRAPEVPTRLVLGLGARGVIGAEPLPSGGGSALVGFEHGHLELDALARFDVPVTILFGSGRVTASALLGELAPCYRDVWWGACAVISAGALRVAGDGFLTNLRQTGVVLLLGARAFAELKLNQLLSLRGDLTLSANLLRVSVVVDATPVWTTPDLVGALGVNLVMKVP
jgi:hypothetical protein